MNKTKIDWATMTWNPVTGCLRGCPYCYAEKIAKRFGQDAVLEKGNVWLVLDEPYYYGRVLPTRSPFPVGFQPTFHRYRLDEPAKIKQPQNVFVCSMADLFGDWVYDEWIEKVFEACNKAPQHRYLFLTKNPQRLIDLNRQDELPLTKNFWYGTTITRDGQFFAGDRNTFLSIEPIMGEFGKCENITNKLIQWVIVGAETGNRKGKVIPKREWIEEIVENCRKRNIPVFLKNSLRDIWGESLIQEYPWGEENV